MREQLHEFARRLIDPGKATVAILPQSNDSGYWFGGGNLVEDAAGHLYLVGRYRNHGDSRTGLAAGERGLELAIFRSTDQGQSFDKIASWSKADLSHEGYEVLSIEGSALAMEDDGSVELFVSTEKAGVGYPQGLESYLKPGTGVWSIDRLAASSISDLSGARVEKLLASSDPAHLHWKDPAVYRAADGALVVLFCTHPFSWSSSNTAMAIRAAGENTFQPPLLDVFPRGSTWDVAITRGTCLLDIPARGPFKDQRCGLLFYDGGESLRNLDEHAQSVQRPRGYSCEELAGVACYFDGEYTRPERLSLHFPSFVSPTGTGCLRYIDVLAGRNAYYATWQQSQENLSQPLMLNVVEY